MKKKIIILGSTGSIGKNTISLIKKDKKNFNVVLLSANTKIEKLMKQALEFNVKNLIITDHKKFLLAKKRYKKYKINFYNNFIIIDKLFKKKEIYYCMVAIVGIFGLNPTIKLIKYTQNIAIVNKEALICGWNIINKELKKNKTNFFPIDSEHFSIAKLINNENPKNIKKIFITASGGPFLNMSVSKLLSVTLNHALNHPKWKMGKKITIDSSTMMNKVFEVIEAKNIFNIAYDKINILTHPHSYIHAIIHFKNGLTKVLLHETDMKIPIYNSIYDSKKNYPKNKNLKFDILNNLNLKKIDTKLFPVVNLIKKLPKQNTLYETSLVAVNDFFVDKFLKRKIRYHELISFILKYANYKDFVKLKKKPAKNIGDIEKILKHVYLKLSSISI